MEQLLEQGVDDELQAFQQQNSTLTEHGQNQLPADDQDCDTCQNPKHFLVNSVLLVSSLTGRIESIDPFISSEPIHLLPSMLNVRKNQALMQALVRKPPVRP